MADRPVGMGVGMIPLSAFDMWFRLNDEPVSLRLIKLARAADAEFVAHHAVQAKAKAKATPPTPRRR